VKGIVLHKGNDGGERGGAGQLNFIKIKQGRVQAAREKSIRKECVNYISLKTKNNGRKDDIKTRQIEKARGEQDED